MQQQALHSSTRKYNFGIVLGPIVAKTIPQKHPTATQNAREMQPTIGEKA